MNFVIPPQLNDLMLSRGTQGKDWLNKLPSVLDNIEKEWHVKLTTPFLKCYCNYVSKATTNNGKQVVVKVSYPDDEFFREIGYLKLQSKELVPEVLRIDESIPAVMMEEIEPATSLATIKNEGESVKIAACLMKKSWKEIDSENIFRKTTTLYSEFQRLSKHVGMTDMFSSDLVRKADKYYQNTLQNPPKSVLLHGDLHQFNMIFSETKGWLIIDPSGFFGDPAYEVSAFLRNPPTISNEVRLKELLSNRITLFSKELNIDPHRILWWGLFQTVLSSWWAREDYSDFLKGFEVTAKTLGEIEL